MLQNTSSTEPLRLRNLSDEEFEEAEALAKQGTPLNECPTCGAKRIQVEPNVYGWENGTYKLYGETYDCDCQYQMKLRRHYLAANIGDQYQRLNWDDYDVPEVRADVDFYLRHYEGCKRQGIGMTFSGGLGTGKTFAATHIGRCLVKRNERVYFTPFLNVISSYQKQNADQLERRMKQTGVLILDELLPPDPGPQQLLFSRRFEELIRHRTNFNLPTIITTNLKKDELLDHYPRTYSLLAAKQIEVELPDLPDARRKFINTEMLELVANGEVKPIT